jgi:hypothetical protein
MINIRLLLLLVMSCSGASARASTVAPDPIAFHATVMANPNIAKSDGELFCWHARIGADDLVLGYETTGDVRWLEQAVRYFDFLIGRLAKDPDGYEGWIGHTIWHVTKRADHSAYRADTKVGDALLLQPMLRFAELVKADPALADRFGAAARQYVDLAIRIGWEKWNGRGVYYRDASGLGSYRINPRFIDAKTWQWVPAPVFPHSENLNKHSAMAIVMLRLWRITGRVEFRTRAEEIMARLKHLFRLLPEEDRVIWNFWMPHGPHDLKGDKVASWMDVHPNRPSYQSEEVARMVEMYDSGLVFDRDDMRRLVNTNLAMMPAEANGQWRSANGATTAGKIWPSLARFDERIRERWMQTLRGSDKPKDRLELAYAENVVARQPDRNRLHVTDESQVRVHAHAPQPGRALSATVLIPNRLVTGLEPPDVVRIVTQTRGKGHLKIELLAADGQRVLGTLHEGPAAANGAVSVPTWDGTNPATGLREAGDYVVRWTLGDEVRTEKIVVETGPVARPAVSASAHQGDHVPANVLDGDLATRWSAEGNDHWLAIDLGSVRDVEGVTVAFMQGDRRNSLFLIQVSDDAAAWRTVFEGQSNGRSTAGERFAFPPTQARHVRYLGQGNSDNAWNSVTEFRVVGPGGRLLP